MADLAPGSVLGRYRIERVLGRGGMGVVYLARDAELDRQVALKVLAPELAGDAAFRERFIRESRIAASLEDPNVVPIHEAGELDGFLFIAMRYVPGTDFRSLIEREGPLPAERAVAIVAQVASALDAAHRRGLVHRDVKPGNVLVAGRDGSRAEHVYLTDFGLVRRMAQGTALTKTGQFMGSIDYVAPEQIRGEPVDGRADVYSLGCLLYECLTGMTPFKSDREVTVLYAHLEEAPPRVTDARPDLPPAIDRVVARAMAKRPADRYATASELADDARKALSAGAPAAPPSRRRLMVAAAAAAVVVVGVAATIFSLGRHAATTVPPPKHGSSASAPGSPAAPVTIANGIVAFDPKTDRVTKTVAGTFGRGAFARNNFLEAGEAGVWTSDADANLVRIDPGTGAEQTVPLSHVQNPVDGITVGEGSGWSCGHRAGSAICSASIRPH
ncbi:MAG: serine/threonine protein kinase [Actinomycetota bacterium]|nr:serine/threonine protein kinase [Actinomycetota bacterium]